MKPHLVLLASLAATSLFALADDGTGKLPPEWFMAGHAPKNYVAGIDYHATRGAAGAKFIRYDSGDKNSWGTLMQQFKADDYRGKRVRFQALVKTADVSKWAGLWMRIDTKETTNARFYNSSDKPIKGSTDWQVRSVTLDVPSDARMISFGVIDEGTGQVWLDELKFDVVGPEVPTDAMPYFAEPARKPVL
jgi:hypothetical protein